MVILPLLGQLGWDIANADEIYPQKELPGAGKVDYDLQVGRDSRVFVEVKNWKIELKSGDEPEKQLERYCRAGKPKLAVLTNGRQWWLYLLPRRWTKSAKLGDYHFLELSLTDGAREVEKNFRQFLSRVNMSSKQSVDQALSNAHNLLGERIDDAAIMQGLTEAWNELEADEQALEYVVARLAERRDIQAKESQIKQFLHSRKPSVNRVTEAKKPISFPRPAKFTFQTGDGQPVVKAVPKNKGWNKLLIDVCEIMLERRADTFDKAIREMPKWFSKSEDGLKYPQQIGSTGIYVEYGGTNAIKKFVPLLLTKCGYSPNSLTIEER